MSYFHPSNTLYPYQMHVVVLECNAFSAWQRFYNNTYTFVLPWYTFNSGYLLYIETLGAQVTHI